MDVTMSDLRYIAELWLDEYGADTPLVVRGWAAQLNTAPAAAQFLEDIADVAQALLAEGRTGRPAASTTDEEKGTAH
jgi:hypothetical protein